MQLIRFDGDIEVPGYVKDAIRPLIASISDKDIDITIEKHKSEKTDQQRKYLWALIRKLRQHLKNGITEEDVYIHLLRVYGISDWLALPEEQIFLAKEYFRIVEDKGESVLRTPTGKEISVRQLRCWKGLSQYSTEEACMLIDGVVEECKGYRIPTDTPNQIIKLKALWGVDIG